MVRMPQGSYDSGTPCQVPHRRGVPVPTEAILIVIAAAIAVNLVIMAMLVGMLLVRRRRRSSTLGFDATPYLPSDPEPAATAGAQYVGSPPTEQPLGESVDHSALGEVLMVAPMPSNDGHQTAADSPAERPFEDDDP